MLARLTFIALRRRAQLGVRQSSPDGIGAVVFAAAQSWLGCKAPLIWGVVGKSNAADIRQNQSRMRWRLGMGRGASIGSPGVDLTQDTETVGIMVRLKVLDHNKQDS